METAKDQITLDNLLVGSRLVVRSQRDWRFAAVAKKDEHRVTLTVCSPTGRTYRLWRDLDAEIFVEDTVPVLLYDEPDDWRENLSSYDFRW